MSGKLCCLLPPDGGSGYGVWMIHYGTDFESISTMLDMPLQEAPNAGPRASDYM